MVVVGTTCVLPWVCCATRTGEQLELEKKKRKLAPICASKVSSLVSGTTATGVAVVKGDEATRIINKTAFFDAQGT